MSITSSDRSSASWEMTPCVTAAHVPTEIWMARNFLNCGSRTLSIRDKAGYYKYDLGHFVGVYQGLFAERPELFALVDGKRIPEGFVGAGQIRNSRNMP